MMVWEEGHWLKGRAQHGGKCRSGSGRRRQAAAGGGRTLAVAVGNQVGRAAAVALIIYCRVGVVALVVRNEARSLLLLCSPAPRPAGL